MSGKRCYYEVLGVEKTASVEVITKAYRSLAMKHHPDRNVGDEEAEVKFKEAAEAYEVLRDDDKRARYDRYGHAGLEGGGGPNFNSAQDVFDLFGNFFGDMFGGGGGGGRGGQGGRHIQVAVELDLVEAYRGCKKTITIPREENCGDCSGSGAKKGSKTAQCQQCRGRGVVIMQQGFFRMQQPCRSCGGRGKIITEPCGTCHGQGRVQVKRTLEINIPPGVDNGIKVRHGGEGEAGAPGQARGDLLVVIRVRDNEMFQRDGNHLICRVPVTISQAALGAEIDVPTLDGPTQMPLPRGTQSGDVHRIPRRGMPDVHGGSRGDLLVQVIIETPRSLTKRQEELYRELAELDQKNVSPERKSFLERIKSFFVPEESE
ncbi:MAG: molecular chaperone DnaJ [Gemmataceae bacterium]|nr:molecular chaperone DnaJ [Gemmataceae bacterium]